MPNDIGYEAFTQLPPVEVDILDAVSRGQYDTFIASKLRINRDALSTYKSKTMKYCGVVHYIEVVRLACSVDWFREPLGDKPHRMLDLDERQVLEMLSHGKSLKAIGKRLVCRPRDLREMQMGIMRGVGAATLPHAVRICYENDMLPLDVPDLME